MRSRICRSQSRVRSRLQSEIFTEINLVQEYASHSGDRPGAVGLGSDPLLV